MRRKRKGAKNAVPAVTPEAFATAVSDAVAQALDPVSKKLDALLEGQQETVKLDDATLEIMGVDSADELGAILDEATEIAADNLEQNDDPVAAAVIDAGLDTSEVLDELVKGRKSRKDAGETLSPVTVEEVAKVIETVAGEIADELSDNELQQLADDGYLDESEVEGAENGKSGAKRRGKNSTHNTVGRSRKSQAAPSYQMKKANTPPLQRKYSDIFMGSRNNQRDQREQKKISPIAMFGRAVKCSDYFARGGASGGFADPERAAWAAERYYKDADLARQFKSMSVTDPSSAGVLVPQDYVDDIIEMLYNNTVLFELGAQKMPMPHGNLSIPRQSSGARAMFGGEARPISTSQPTFSVLHLSAKRLQAMVIMTEELMRSTDMSADTIFGNDLVMQIRLGVEWGGLMAPGTQFTPLGLYHNPDVETVDLLDVDDEQIADDEGRPSADLPIFIKGKVLQKNIIGTSFGWTFNSEAEQYFMRMKYTDGSYVWKEEMDKGTFNGDKYRTTNMIPTSDDGTTTAFFGNWNDFIAAEQFGLETRTTYDATVPTENGDVNTFATVQTATRATTYIDMGNRHNESFIKVKNMKVRG